MKRVILLALICLTAFACSSDDAPARRVTESFLSFKIYKDIDGTTFSETIVVNDPVIALVKNHDHYDMLLEGIAYFEGTTTEKCRVSITMSDYSITAVEVIHTMEDNGLHTTAYNAFVPGPMGSFSQSGSRTTVKNKTSASVEFSGGLISEANDEAYLAEGYITMEIE